jgi:glucan biosynthesis protein C
MQMPQEERLNVKTSKPERRHDLDWLRVLAVLLLVPFHSALIFSLEPGDIVYVKDQVENQIIIQFAYFLHQWQMPLLFLIAGASTWFALEFRAGRQYLKERFTRLVIPAIFGIAVLIPFMVYVQFLGKPDFDSFWQFYPRFFKVNPEDLTGYSGTFTPGHLWFVIFLFVFSVVALPLFLYLKRETGRRLIARRATFFERRGAIFLLALPLTITAALPDLGGMPPFLCITLFIYGYILVADARFQKILDRHTASALVFGIIATVPITLWGNPFPRYSLGDILIHFMYYLSRWCWVIAILGLGHKYLGTNNKVLRYAREAAYPFYILHLPINTLVGHFIIQWHMSIAAKYLVITTATTVTTVVVYDVLVKRTNVTRFLFGMRPQVKEPSVPRSAEQEFRPHISR